MKSYSITVVLIVIAASAAMARPNFVVILADDMGYSDLGAYGGEIDTPNLDRLARQGLRFTQFYNTGRCSPTRASLLTGRYSHAVGMGHLADGDWGRAGYRGSIREDIATLPELLRAAGYRGYMAGKWHLSPELGPSGASTWPNARGFDRFYGNLTGGGSFFDPPTLMRDGRPVSPEDGFYFTDAISDAAIDFILKHDASAPFFLYVAYTAPHWPLHARQQDIDKYRGRYAEGWDELRSRRYRRAVDLGVVDASWPMSPRDTDVPPWSEAAHPEWEERRMEVYAAQIDRMDQGIGRIIAVLEDRKLIDDAVILFLSDNGACAEAFPRWLPSWTPLLSHILPAATRAGEPVQRGNDPAVMPGGEETFQTYGRAWANASNTPYRLYKSWVHEGGIITPLIVHWPAGLQTSPGSVTDDVGHVIDIVPTFLELAGVEAATDLPGESFVGALRNQSRDRGPLFWEHEGNRSVREGDWKLVSEWRGEWELYDLSNDGTELVDLAAANPERVARMAAMYERFAADSGVESWPWVAAPVRYVLTGAGIVLVALMLAAAGLLLRARRRRSA